MTTTAMGPRIIVCMKCSARRFQWLCTKSLISLCNLCILCDSVVVFPEQSSTSEAQTTQRLHREQHVGPLGLRRASKVSKASKVVELLTLLMLCLDPTA